MYTFAAMANDSSALLAMGYSHMKGLGVPKSCESAALYYIAAAEQIVAAAQQPGGLDAVRSASAGHCCTRRTWITAQVCSQKLVAACHQAIVLSTPAHAVTSARY